MLGFELSIDHAMMSKKRRHDRVGPKAMLDSQNLVAGGRLGLGS
jgi:hypothetical protein